VEEKQDGGKFAKRGRIVKTIVLETPIPWGTEKIERLEFEEMKGKHLFDSPADPKAQTIGTTFEVASRLTAVPMEALGELTPADLAQVAAYVGELMAPFLEGGSKPGDGSSAP